MGFVRADANWIGFPFGSVFCFTFSSFLLGLCGFVDCHCGGAQFSIILGLA
jgi:hypothetical protein